ncbi:MAG: alanine--glyoxylate aminotransferase family protein [Campylobacterales bacterium]|nr:alanine--glyoxylate aminotransferase family protein [Campylobacterales bacterium]
MKQYIFTPGPVPMSKEVLAIGAKQVPYFRNEFFSNVMLECKKLLLKLSNAPKGSEVIFLTSSGTGAMEATVRNLLDASSKPIIINGGGFGHRFVEICDKNDITNHPVKLDKDEKIDFKKLSLLDADSFIINAHETTIGRLYDLKKTGKFCKKNDLLHIVDAISAFVCDDINMKKQNIDALIISSNKGLALPPALGMVILSPKALEHLKDTKELYFNFKDYISNIQRGQTPFTPAISVILQLHYRLKELKKIPKKQMYADVKELADYFRDSIKKLPLKPFVDEMPNGMTALTTTDGKSAYKIVEDFEKKYNIILTPSGGELKDKLIRISHMGAMDKKYIDVLIDALHDYYGVKR